MFRSSWLLLALALVACGRIGFDEIGGGDDGGTETGLRFENAPLSVNLSSVVDLAAVGGTAPYSYAVSSGSVTDTGSMRCPARAETVTATVTDDAGDTASIAIACGGEQLFLIGGARTVDGIVVDEVLASADGISWSLHGHVPAAIVYGGAVVFNDFIFVLGGQTMAGTYLDAVWRSADGMAWEQVGSIPEVLVSSSVTVHRGELWTIAGFRSPAPDSRRAYRSADGVSWTRVADLPQSTHDAFAISRGDFIYVVGGHFSDVVYRTVDGSTWEALPGRLTAPIDDGALGELGDRVIYVSGIDMMSSISDDLMTWAPGPLLPPSKVAAVIGFRGQLLLLAGAQVIDIRPQSTPVIGSLPRAADGPRVVQFTPR